MKGVECFVVFFIVAVRAVQIDTVPHLNLSQYTGRWYQVYTDRTTELTTERGCNCFMAEYGLFDDNDSVTVLNACRHGAPNGFIHTTSGVAYRPNPSEQGKLMVKLNGSLASNYWVIQLGPATFNETFYQYSVVTDPGQLQLTVLARNVTGFFIDYAEKVRLHLQYEGFTKYYNMPIVTYQGNDCKYIL